MFTGTFTDLAEIASKKYDKKAKVELEKQLSFFSQEYSKETIKQLGLPQVLMFLSAATAKSNAHKNIESADVEEAFAFLRFLVSRDFVEEIMLKGYFNIGLRLSENLTGRLDNLLNVKGDMRSKNNLDGKVNRLVSFLKEQKLDHKHVTRIEVEMRAMILLLARLIAVSKAKPEYKVSSEAIDTSYDIVRYLIFKLETTKFKILQNLYSIDNKKVWNKIPRITFDQSTHDHLSSTAYAEWESNLPESFETLKKHLNCSLRPFISAIHGFCEIYGAKKDLTRVSSQELLFILEDFERLVFGNSNPLLIEGYLNRIAFTTEGLELLGSISKWITTIIITKFGKDEFVLSFSSTVPRQISLLFFMALVEQVKSKEQKITVKHVAIAIDKWANQLRILTSLTENSLH